MFHVNLFCNSQFLNPFPNNSSFHQLNDINHPSINMTDSQFTPTHPMLSQQMDTIFTMTSKKTNLSPVTSTSTSVDTNRLDNTTFVSFNPTIRPPSTTGYPFPSFTTAAYEQPTKSSGGSYDAIPFKLPVSFSEMLLSSTRLADSQEESRVHGNAADGESGPFLIRDIYVTVNL